MFTFKHFFLLNFHCSTYSASSESKSNQAMLKELVLLTFFVGSYPCPVGSMCARSTNAMNFQSNHHLNLNKYHSFLMTLFLYLSTFFTFVIFWTLRKLSIIYERMRNSKVVFEHLSRRNDLCTPTPTPPWPTMVDILG